MANKTNQFPVKFSMTATNEREFLAAEEYLNIIGAKSRATTDSMPIGTTGGSYIPSQGLSKGGAIWKRRLLVIVSSILR